MAKDPAFLFYPSDWISGTMHLDFECKGAYLELLMLQFNRGHMTSHMIGQVLGQKYGQIWPKIADKFQTDGVNFWNERLKDEKESRLNFTKSRRNNLLGHNQHQKNGVKEGGHKTSHMTSHMENVNEDIDIVIINNKGVFKKPTLEQVTDYLTEKNYPKEAERFYDYYTSNGWRVGKNPMKDWQAACRNWIKNKSNDGQTTKEPTIGRLPISGIERFIKGGG